MEEIEKQQFNFNDAVQQLLSGKNINGKDGILAPLVKQLVEAALEAELDSHITQDVFSGNKNRKNGKTSKTIKSTSGTFELETPRDRVGSFEPQIVKKNQTTISNEIEERILSMYGLGLSYKDIIKHIEEIYQIELSTATISAITDKIIASVDGLKGFPEAIKTIYPKTEVQLCVVHQIRNSLKYVASKDQKEFMRDFLCLHSLREN